MLEKNELYHVEFAVHKKRMNSSIFREVLFTSNYKTGYLPGPFKLWPYTVTSGSYYFYDENVIKSLESNQFGQIPQLSVIKYL